MLIDLPHLPDYVNLDFIPLTLSLVCNSFDQKPLLKWYEQSIGTLQFYYIEGKLNAHEYCGIFSEVNYNLWCVTGVSHKRLSQTHFNITVNPVYTYM